MNTPIGLFGGSFDPIHHGHLRSALDIANHIGLKSVTFIPAYVSPHKSIDSSKNISQVSQHNQHRLNMIELAIEHSDQFLLCDDEIKREGISFTIDTIEQFKAQNPHTPLCFLMGLDSLISFTRWHRWQDILSHCHLVVSHRPGYSINQADINELLTQSQTHSVEALHNQCGGLIYLHQENPLAISSSSIRELRNNKQSIDYLTPSNVVSYINKYQLYR